MRVENLTPSRNRLEGGERRSWWVSGAFLIFGVPLGVWNFIAILGTGASDLASFELAAAWFVLLAVCFLALHGLERMAWSSIPFLLTVEALAYFVVVPLWRFAAGDDQVDAGYAHAMWLALIGFAAFWLGCLTLLRNTRMQFVPRTQNTPEHVALASAVMCGVGVVVKLVMWRAGLFSYLADPSKRAASQGVLQWLGFLADLLNWGLVVSAIEIFGKGSRQPLIRVVFVLSLVSSVGFGVISGMKGEIVQPILFVMLVYGIVRGRLPRTAVLLPVILILFIYPFVTAYRNNLSQGYSAQVNTLGGLEATLAQSFDDAFLSFGSRTAEAAQTSSEARRRLSYLSDLHDILDLPAPSLLAGDEKIWLAPIYPLIPRFLWKDKPVMDKGARFARAMGSPIGTSAAMTPIGDLYSQYGSYGVALGMFVYGLCLQGYMNWRASQLSERGLFIYVSMLITFLSFESDVVGTVGREIQVLLVAVVASFVIYGRQSAPAQLKRLR